MVNSGINRIRLEFKDEHRDNADRCQHSVLIESDWNLKGSEPTLSVQRQHRINRIRLEFKGIQPSESAWLTSVLIESDWNLKLTVILTVFPDACINRIRLEFKV